MAKLVLVFLCTVLACVAGQRITTIQLDGVQYFISRMNPYSPELNYFLAYQYCRSLGLQLASFETKEKVESMSTYLRNAGYSKYDFWTSGNRLGTGMFLWMSTGLPFNATFDYFENAEDSAKAGLLEPVDHNSNTTPQRTARDSSSVLSKNCVIMRGPILRWVPEDCSAVKDFICEQTRCYYYNYGSIPVSSAQGRPITSTTARQPLPYTTTPIPEVITSTLATLLARQNKVEENILAKSASVETANALADESNASEHPVQEEEVPESAARDEDESFLSEEDGTEEEHEVEETGEETEEDEGEERSLHAGSEKGVELVQNIDESPEVPAAKAAVADDQPSVEQRLKQISEQIEKLGSAENNDGDLGHQSFLSLSDLIKTLRPNDKKVPQIDSDYSNTMRVLGEKSLITNNASEESRKLKDTSAETGKVVY